MSQPSIEAARSLWDYATASYDRPGVAESCLWFQDHCRGDVPVILFISWCFTPLRGLRRELKRDSKGIAQETVFAFREKLKALELEAEHLELNALVTLSYDKTVSTVSVSDQKKLIESGLVQYLGELNCDIDAQTREKISTFIACLLAE